MRGLVSTRLSWFVAEEGNPIARHTVLIVSFFLINSFQCIEEAGPEFLIHGTVFDLTLIITVVVFPQTLLQ